MRRHFQGAVDEIGGIGQVAAPGFETNTPQPPKACMSLWQKVTSRRCIAAASTLFILATTSSPSDPVEQSPKPNEQQHECLSCMLTWQRPSSMWGSMPTAPCILI